ncbi:Gaa1-like protein, partial [Halteromyces radiatus]|uniref:Gaa1-like protein n=1 Tax=Halteromyces radiatus TaxID=101107 RepID=UPI00221EF9D8
MLLSRIKARLGGKKRRTQLGLEKKQKLYNLINKYITPFCILLFLIGSCWLLLLPYDGYSKQTYISENALLPGQVNVYYGYNDIHTAEDYRNKLLAIQTMNITVRSTFIQTELRKVGFTTAIQHFDMNGLSGINAFAIYRTPRSDGKEALVLSAPWISRTGDYNTNGIATLLSLSKLFKRNVYWSKDIILLVTDHENVGTQAWLEAYHGIEQKGQETLSSLAMPRSGAIQGVVNLDFPGVNDYASLGLFFEGVNGQLPNLDLINTIRVVAQNTARVPITLHDEMEAGSNHEQSLSIRYWISLKHVLRTMKYQVIGHPSSDAGQYLRYKIDAVTIHGIHGSDQLDALFGFHRIGVLIESTFRSLNNLLEHFHQSFFFYLLPNVTRYVSIGAYMPPIILYACSLVFQSLALYYLDPKALESDYQETKSRKGAVHSAYTVYRKPISFSFLILGIVHLTGMVTLYMMQPWVTNWLEERFHDQELIIQFSIVSGISLMTILWTSIWVTQTCSPLHDGRMLKSICLAVSAMIIATVSLLNLSLAVATSLATVIPYTLIRPTSSYFWRLIQCLLLILLSPVGLVLIYSNVADTHVTTLLSQLIFDYQIVHSWFIVFICMVYWPINMAMVVLVFTTWQ